VTDESDLLRRLIEDKLEEVLIVKPAPTRPQELTETVQ